LSSDDDPEARSGWQTSHVDACWDQYWTGSDRVRFYRLDGDKLSIRGAKISDLTTGEEVIHRMEFQRIMQQAKQAPPN
jgi:hypothetical protein